MAQNSKKILIVEDNPDNSQLAQKILEHYGYQTVIIENGEQAIEWCQTNNTDLVLMDISLPNKDGLETTAELRQIPHYKNIPIIALTAHAMVGWEQKCKEAGCTEYITKPFRPKQLMQNVQKYF